MRRSLRFLPDRLKRRMPRRTLFAAGLAALVLLGLGLIVPGMLPDPPPGPPARVTLPVLPPPHAAAPPPVAPADAPPPVTHADAPPSLPPAWRRYAAAVPPTAGRPMVAVVIDDLGIDRRRSERAVALPAPVTLAFLPYAEHLPAQAAAARAAGHELLVHLPMEPVDPRADPGPHALLSGLPPQELARRLQWNLGRFEGYVGANNHMGSRFTADASGMGVVLAELGRRGLLFLDSKTSPASVGVPLGLRLGVPVAGRDVFLDNDLAPDRVEAQLAALEQVARRNGRAVAIGHPHDETLAALQRWLPALEARGLVLVPLSALVSRPEAG